MVTSPRDGMAQRPFKVYISVDMEGIAGVVTGDQLGPAGFEYGRAREFMTQEALAAVAAAREAGATEILVSDSHGNGESLLIDQFPDDVRIVRSWPRPLMMMEGIDSTFAAAIFIGYHAGTTNAAGVRAHTISSANLASVSLNGVAVPEAGINAAIAGRFGVPVVFVSGDDVAVEETRRLLGDVEGAVVKRAISFHSAATMTPKAAQQLIRERVKAALARRASFKPYVVRAPVTLDVVFKNYRPAEILAYLPIVQRTTAHSIRFMGRDMVEVSRFLEFIGTYEPGISP
jgi:D-amino peptidase